MASSVFAQTFQDVVKVNNANTKDELDEICKSVNQNYAFNNTPDEIENIIKQIIETAGLNNRSFKLKQCSNIDNAVAKIITQNAEDIRYIIYDGEWLESINNNTNNDWSGKFILAHEIGHHLAGHSLTTGGSKPPLELEADYFAGKALSNLGASLEETLAVTKKMNEFGTSTHPARAEAAERGWKSVKNKKTKKIYQFIKIKTGKS